MHGLFLLLLGCSRVGLDDDRPCPEDTCLEGSLGSYEIAAGAERDGICLSWTVDNAEPLYVNAVTAENDGWYHHSNWFWVPESEWDVADGAWDCSDHQFTELKAATRGGVLFAQSTQIDRETQQFLPGYAVKIPPRSRIIAYAHLLNWDTSDHVSELRVRLDLLAQKDVEAVLAPARFSYLDLDLPAGRATEHAGACEQRTIYEAVTETAFDVRLHYILPHFHNLGTGFTASILGGPRDGEPILELTDAWGHAWGTTFPEPIDLSDADGLRMACQHDNPREVPVGWGIGDQEMCVALMFLESKMMLENTVLETETVDDDGTTVLNTGNCLVIGAPFIP